MAAVDLEACVSRVLETLSVAALQLMCDALTAQRTMLEAEILKLEGQILKHDIIAAKVDALQAIAVAALDPIESKLSVFPTNIVRYVATCADLGEIVTSPQQILGNVRAVVDRLTYKARELASFSGELALAKQTALDLLQKLSDACDLIAVIIIQKQSPPAV